MQRVRFLYVAAVLAVSAWDALGRESVRIGAWQPAPLAWWAILSALSVAALVLPRPVRAPRSLALGALAAFVTALLALQIARTGGRHRPEPMAVQVRSLLRGETREMHLSLDRLRTPARSAEAIGTREPSAFTLSGFLELPETGRYELRMHCGGACVLYLDGRPVLQGTQRAILDLAAGQPAFRLEVVGAKGPAWAWLDWNRPALLEAVRLPAALRASPSGSRSQGILQRDRAAVRRAVLQFTLAVLCAFTLAAACAGARAFARRAPAHLAAWWAEPPHRLALVAALFALLWLLALRAWVLPRAPDGYLHPWTSEYLMQTVSAADLREQPLRSIAYNHIQPPLFDTLRATLVAFHGRVPEANLVAAVDRGLYACWALAFAAATGLVAAWGHRAASPRCGVVAAAVFAAHPATLFYATFLDTTFVSAVGILWMTYELWRLSRDPGASPVRLVCAVLALFLTRSIVQLPFVLVLAAAIGLRGVDRRRVLQASGTVALVMTLFVAKQYALFGLLTTSSFGPDSFCKGLSAYCPGTAEVRSSRPLPDPASASVLSRVEKLGGAYNYNQLAFLRRSFAQMQEYKALLAALSWPEGGRLMRHNLEIWSRPSSRYSAHVLVDALPWRGVFDRALSGVRLVGLLGMACAVWLLSAGRSAARLRAGIGLALPALYVIAASIAFESGENMRYKYFVEPLFLVFLCVQGRAIFERLGWRK